MTDKEIDLLKRALKLQHHVYWIPNSYTANKVMGVGKHAEEGDGSPCALFSRGRYAALDNCELQHFKIVQPLTEDTLYVPVGQGEQGEHEEIMREIGH